MGAAVVGQAPLGKVGTGECGNLQATIAPHGVQGSFRRLGVQHMSAIIQLREGNTLLAVVHNGTVMAHTWDIALSHKEFVRRSMGELPSGGWVGTIRKMDGHVMAFNSWTFYGNQLPAPPSIFDAVRMMFR